MASRTHEVPAYLIPINTAARDAHVALFDLQLECLNVYEFNLPYGFKMDVLIFIKMLEKATETIERYQRRLTRAPPQLEEPGLQRCFIQNIDDHLARSDAMYMDTIDFKPHQNLLRRHLRLKEKAKQAFTAIGVLIQRFSLTSDHLIDVRDEILDLYITIDQADLHPIE